MPLPLSSSIISRKNKISDTGAWLILLELIMPTAIQNYEIVTHDGDELIHDGEILYSDVTNVLRFANNTEDVVWDSENWVAFPFNLNDVVEDGKGGLPTFSIDVSNVGRVLTKIIEDVAGAVGSTARLILVHSDLLNEDPVFDEKYSIISCSVNLDWISFTLGAENPLRNRAPKQRYLMDHCRYKVFKGTLCGYGGAESECNRTFARCVELGNTTRFGGFPGVGLSGVYV